VADQPNPDISLAKLAEVIADADKSGVEYAEYLKTLRRTAKEAQDMLDQSEREYLDNLRLIRDDAQARLAAAESIADACSATKKRKTRKDKGTSKGPKGQVVTQQTLIPNKPAANELPTDFPDGPPAELSDEPF
jgi:uncharacterized NAD(P)/FAD-binding protein YdhS